MAKLKETKKVHKIDTAGTEALKDKVKAFLTKHKNHPEVTKRGFVQKYFGKIEIDGDEKLVRDIDKFVNRGGGTVMFNSKKLDLAKKLRRSTAEKPQIEIVQDHIKKVGDPPEFFEMYMEDIKKGNREFSKENTRRSKQSLAEGGEAIEKGHINSLKERLIKDHPDHVPPTEPRNLFSQPKGENRSDGGKGGSFSKEASIGTVPRDYVEGYEMWKAEHLERTTGEKNPFMMYHDLDPSEQAALHKLPKDASRYDVDTEFNLQDEVRGNRQKIADFGNKFNVGGKFRTADSLAQIASGNVIGGGAGLIMQQPAFQKQITKALSKTLAKSGAKLMPGVGVTMGTLEAAGYAKQGRLTQAGIAGFSALVGEVPGIGDFLSAGADLVNTGIDIATGNLGKVEMEMDDVREFDGVPVRAFRRLKNAT